MRLPFPTTIHHRFTLPFSPSFQSQFQFQFQLQFKFQPTLSSLPSSSSSCSCSYSSISVFNQISQTQMEVIDPSSTIAAARRRRRKVVVIMGPTGAGKSRLSLDLATRFFHNAEIINSDKMQVYKGLNITTNKIPMQQRFDIPHHLLGVIDPTKTVFTASDFRKIASEIVSDIKLRRGLPVVVGGSNSLIYSLLAKRYDPKSDVFSDPISDVLSDPKSDVFSKLNGFNEINGSETDPIGSISSELRYDCCFIWVDVSLPVLNQYLSNRVDEMLESGMVDELTEFYESGENKLVMKSGLGQAIGVPEFEGYFKRLQEMQNNGELGENGELESGYEEAVRRIKDNTCQLAKKQVKKIQRLRDAGWGLKRVDATEAFRAVVTAESGGGRVAEIWEKQVVEPSVKIVKQFLDDLSPPLQEIESEWV